MRLSRYISLLTAILICIAARGQGFNPDSPGEPNPTYKLTLKADPAEAAQVSGSGRYRVRTNVSVRATANSSDWKFVNWTNSNGEVVKTSSSFTYTTSNYDETLTAHYTQVETSTLTTQSKPASLFAASTTSYAVGTSVSVSCNTYSNFTFVNWTDKDGNEVSTSRSFTYKTTSANQVLTANYIFNPSSPSEPFESKPKHHVYFSAYPTAGGSISQTSGMLVSEGSTYSLTASNASNYSFRNWTINGVEVSTSKTYSATMGDKDVNLVANFYFNPGSPADPGASTKKRYSLYANTLYINKGESAQYPIYLENSGTPKALTFTMQLPQGFEVNTSAVQTTSRTSAYTPAVTFLGQTLTVTLSGGTQISDNNGPILYIPIKASDALEDGTYNLNFASASITLADNSTPTITFRNGLAEVKTAEDGEVRAQFSFDRYMNRVQFSNQSSSYSRTYTWDFGDGQTSTDENPMHVYAEAGVYTVRLTARGMSREDVAEQSIVINPASSWTSGGDYTLDPNGTGVRNFTSVNEMTSLLAQCNPETDIVVNVINKSGNAGTYTEAADIAQLSTLASKLATANRHIIFASDDAATVSLSVPSESEALKAALSLAHNVSLQNTAFTINGATINPEGFVTATSQTVCSDNPTSAIAFDAFCTSNASVAWYATVAESCKLEGYQVVGTGNIPSMLITNPGNSTDVIKYHVTLLFDGVEVEDFIYQMNVKPTILGRAFANGTPSAGSTVNFGSQQLRWTNLGSIATGGYTLHITRELDGEEVELTPINTTSYYYSIEALPGAKYTWYVEAFGDCDAVLTSEATSFTVRTKSNLQVLSVTAPESGKAGKSITVKATIKNVSDLATSSTGWYDAIYFSTKANDAANAKYVANVYHSGQLAAGASYDATFTITTPEGTEGNVYYYVKADYDNREIESNENDNIMQSDAIELFLSDINSADYEVLKRIYNTLNGETWTQKWRLNTTTTTSSAWPGVTFNEDGRVTSLSLNGNSINGVLDASLFDLPYLKSLNLSRNNFTSIVNDFPASLTSLDMSYQYNDFGLSSIACQDWKMSYVIDNVQLTSIMTYDVSTHTHTAHPTFEVYNANSGSYIGRLTYDAAEEGYKLTFNGVFKLEDGIEIYAQPTSGTAAYNRLHATLCWTLGDANTDGSVDVLDAQHTINYILGTSTGNFNYSAANTYTDALLNVQDVVATVNLFIGEEESNASKRREIASSIDRGSIYTSGSKIMLRSEGDISALDVRLQGVTASQVALQLNRNEFQTVIRNTNDGVRVVVISMSGATIPTGNVCIFRTSSEADILSVKASDENAQFVNIGIGEATGVESITSESAIDHIYDLQGRAVNSVPAKGVYIIDGKKVFKQ